ncbi:MAG: NINE protein [Gemmatimonadetes bacterium]|nr:NINE protein [Gemmatimonadota bacterium]
MGNVSDKSRTVSLVLGLMLGVFGAHRFYVGKFGTGLLMLCSAGGLGIWYLIDNIMIASGGFRDADGRRVLRWDPETADELAGAPKELLDELYALRTEMNELHERVDFNERLLAKRTGPPDQR